MVISIVYDKPVPSMPIKLLGNANFRSWYPMFCAEIEEWAPKLAAFLKGPQFITGVGYDFEISAFMRKNASEKIYRQICTFDSFESFVKKDHTPTMRERAECLHYIANLEGVEESMIEQIRSREEITLIENTIIEVAKNRDMNVRGVLIVLKLWVATRNTMSLRYPDVPYFHSGFPFTHGMTRIEKQLLESLRYEDVWPVPSEHFEETMFFRMLRARGYIPDPSPMTIGPAPGNKRRRTSESKIGDVTCFFCEEKGHVASECDDVPSASTSFKKLRRFLVEAWSTKKSKRRQEEVTSFISANDFADESDYIGYSEPEDNFDSPGGREGSSELSQPMDFLWSTASVVHVVTKKDLLHDFVDKNIYLRTGAHVTKMWGSGTLYLRLINGMVFKLENVHYHPDFHCNIISSRCAIKDGFKPIFMGDGLYMDLQRTDKISEIGTKEMFIIPAVAIKPTSDISGDDIVLATDLESQLMHRRLGHPSPRQYRLLMQTYPELDISAPSKCTSCAKGNTISSVPSPTEAQRPLEILYVDICMSPADNDEMVLIIIDQYSRYTKVIPLLSTRGVSFLIMDFINSAHFSLPGKPKCEILRSHDGSKFVDEDFELFCCQKGIELELHECLEDNSIFVQLCKAFRTKTAVLMKDARMPQRYWSYAFKMAVRYHNFFPLSQISNEVPVFRWCGQRCYLPRFRAFGCLVAGKPSEDYGKNATSVRGAFLGFAPGKKNSYVYDSETGATVEVESAIFLDDRTYFEEEPESDVEDQNQVIPRAGGIFEMNQDQPPLQTGGIYQITY
ncbi:putative retrotransposon [Clavispora lusitaniae]|uniref:Retrotransposon n=1 Tax=Clavispora lusitaniae TaxID=36911 RepID=A0AA91PZN8_CLALS|nr:putative retrotransposon [Clavispora lusitaniae]